MSYLYPLFPSYLGNISFFDQFEWGLSYESNSSEENWQGLIKTFEIKLPLKYLLFSLQETFLLLTNLNGIWLMKTIPRKNLPRKFVPI